MSKACLQQIKGKILNLVHNFKELRVPCIRLCVCEHVCLVLTFDIEVTVMYLCPGGDWIPILSMGTCPYLGLGHCHIGMH